MKTAEAIECLSSLGFEMGKTASPYWGNTKAEPYDAGKHHFTPECRDVYIGWGNGGWYITSDPKGGLRRYRCHDSHTVHLANIFGGGKTLEKAVAEFTHNFKHKVYNRS